MKKFVLLLLFALFVALVLIGCARTWIFQPIETYKPSGAVPPATACQPCHESEFSSWKETRHGEERYMSRIPVAELRECGACHSVTALHLEDPAGNKPTVPTALSKTEKNTLCGKCHYNQNIFGGNAINPHDKHGLYKSVGLEGQEVQIACLDCHSGHHGKTGMGEMLVRYKPNICYECHSGALAYSMGIFMPFNYLAYGKMCQACHTVHGGSKKERWTRMGVGFCVICHFTGTALVD